MRIGLIARADNSGLGIQTWELYRHLDIAKVLVIDVGHLHDDSAHCNKATHLDRYRDPIVFRGWQPDRVQLVEFLTGLDVVLTCETPYNPALYGIAREMGVRTALQLNYEFLDQRPPHPDVLIAPSLWHWDDIVAPPGTRKVHLPVPIASERFWNTLRDKRRSAEHFVHIVGRPAIHDRNGTTDLIRALRHVKSDITVSIRTQDRQFVPALGGIPGNVKIKIERRDVANYWDNYATGDVLVMPRRFGGLCLPVNEALGSGMPVIMTDIPPNHDWLPHKWLVASEYAGTFNAKTPIDYYRADPRALAAKIDEMAIGVIQGPDGPSPFVDAMLTAHNLRHEYSWNNWREAYVEALS